MKRQFSSTVTLGLALLLCSAGAGAQMFKWTDARGVVHFSDQPPPPGSERKVEQKAFGNSADRMQLPYALAEAARKSPVVLYTTPTCTACDQGRAMLTKRGIPFAEKTVVSNEDQQKLAEAGSDGRVPLLLVGGAKLIGFDAGAWNDSLTDAAYPKRKMLPPNYQNPAAESAAPAPAAAEHPLARDVAPETPSPRPKAPPSDTPPGFRF
ncbi:MAG: glutaredoxin family protein [Pseudomonadota bacterium]|nr:glutaredoxin family protein [Pseudomonadota bacterium]